MQHVYGFISLYQCLEGWLGEVASYLKNSQDLKIY